MKAIRIFLLVLIVIGIILIFTQKIWRPKLVSKIILPEAITQVTIPKSTPILITTQKISEQNFSGTVPEISGTSPLAIQMRDYVTNAIAEFRKQANADVPDMRAKYGVDNPTANYEIDITSKYLKNEKSESIVAEVYSYTGGAHGSTIYKVITADVATGKILTLSDVIKKEKQPAFTEFVKKKLISWHPQGGNTSVVFTEEVQSLTFDSFTNWSLNNQDLTIYFDQYAIGPGVLGVTAFTLPLAEIKNFL